MGHRRADTDHFGAFPDVWNDLLNCLPQHLGALLLQFLVFLAVKKTGDRDQLVSRRPPMGWALVH